MTKIKTLREKIIESSIIITSTLIFLGFLKQYWFYNHFGIPIHQYLSIDEIVILFFADLVYIFYLILGGLAYSIFLMIIHKLIKDFTKLKIDELIEKTMKSKVRLLVTLLFSLGFTVLGLFWFNKTMSFCSMIYFAMAAAQTVLLFLEWMNNGKDDKDYRLIMLIVGFSVLVICKSQLDICRSENQVSSTTYTVEMQDTTIQTSSNILYLGKSKDYIYIYNNSTSEASIYKSENVKIYKKIKE